MPGNSSTYKYTMKKILQKNNNILVLTSLQEQKHTIFKQTINASKTNSFKIDWNKHCIAFSIWYFA